MLDIFTINYEKNALGLKLNGIAYSYFEIPFMITSVEAIKRTNNPTNKAEKYFVYLFVT